MNELGQPQNLDPDEIDLLELVRFLWERRLVVLAGVVGCFALALTYAFLIAKPVYESSALLLPTETVNNVDLGAASALLGGKKLGSPDVDLYQSLLTSRTVVQKVLRAKLPNLSDTGKGKPQELYSILEIDTTNPVKLDEASRRLEKSILVDSKESGSGGILEVRFQAGTPWLAQEIGNLVLDIGQTELRQVRIERSNVILSRLQIAVAQARLEWDSAAKEVAKFKDRNRSIILPDQMLALSKLEIDKTAKEQKFLLARKEYELQQLEQAKAVPPMMIFDPASLPSRKSKPNRAMIIIAGILLGFGGSCISLLVFRAFFSGTKHKAQ